MNNHDGIIIHRRNSLNEGISTMPRIQIIPISSLPRVSSNEDHGDILTSRSIHCGSEVSIIQTRNDRCPCGIGFGGDSGERVNEVREISCTCTSSQAELLSIDVVKEWHKWKPRTASPSNSQDANITSTIRAVYMPASLSFNFTPHSYQYVQLTIRPIRVRSSIVPD